MNKVYEKIEKINKVGKTMAGRLKNLGIETIHDLLFHFPFRYEDFSEVTPIAKIQAGETVNIVGTIDLINTKKSPRKKISITEAIIRDKTESLKAIWFNQPFLSKTLRVGDHVSLAGKTDSEYGVPIMKSPNYEKINALSNIHTQGLVPIYHLTQNLTQKQIRFLIKQALPLTNEITDWLPDFIIKEYKLFSIAQALKNIHFPKNDEDLMRAKKRLSFNELYVNNLQSQLIKREMQDSIAQKIIFKEQETQEFVNNLPFKLTDAQKKSAWQILLDMREEQPMSRLLEGDVGSGKTITAVIAMYNVALNKAQSALMVPTEILAQQHYASLKKLIKNTDIKIALFTRTDQKINTAEETNKKEIIKSIADGKIDIIIGTHALIQEKIEFKNLALAVIDEQHRFGVEQRKKLTQKSRASHQKSPHLLSMTATPIPRTMALVLYGELDISIINEMPKGRKKIITRIVREEKRNEAYSFIRQEIKNGRQIFIICPLINPSDKLENKSVQEEYKKLSETIFPDLTVAFLHGKLKSEDKEKIMDNFSKNKINILVSTSVVEVGVDIPNATVMIIEDADRFGLAQLHQFRGRVGRGDHQSYCLLFTNTDSANSLERLDAMTKHHDGFTLSKIDLKQRGPGEVFGTSQKGFPEFKIANLFDHILIEEAQKYALETIKKSPDLGDYPLLQEKIKDWQNKIHLE